MSIGVRLLRASVLLGMATACAHVEAPSGGPDDRTPPDLVTTRPDTLAVVPDWDSPVVFLFSERISEQRVEESVMVSPRTSPVVVDHGGSAIRVRLRRGWEPGRIYHVRIQPTIQDLFNNRLAEPLELVFSTGPAIPDTRLPGVVVDRITGKPDAEARVEAIRRSDSLVYAVPSDSAGGFTFRRIPEGEYLVRAYRDQNRNRALDPFEARDSALRALAGPEAEEVRLATVLPDTTPPRVAGVELTDSQRVEIRFDDYLDPAQTPSAAAVQIVGPEGDSVPVARVTVGSPTPAAAGAAAPVRAATDTATADTAAARAPRLPSQSLAIELAGEARLLPERTYRIHVPGVRNVVGLTADVEAELTTPETPAREPERPGPQPAPADTVRGP